MKTIVLLFCLFIPLQLSAQSECPCSIDYGNNPEAGKYISVNNIKMYYETYGNPEHEPLLLIHGNGGSISGNKCQIEFFKDSYYVIILDSRFHGKSDEGSEELNYRLMTKDYAALLNELKIDSLNIIGQSDGGIIGLMLAMDYPKKVKKLIASAPNIRTDSTAIYNWDLIPLKKELASLNEKIKNGDKSKETFRAKVLLNLMDKYPTIQNEELKKIAAPTLIMTSDEDVIKPEHVLEIYNHIPKAHLFIMPGATHIMPSTEYELFNQMCLRFLKNPFKRPTTKAIFHPE